MSESAAEKEWYADLEILAATQRKSDKNRKRLTVVAIFVFAAFALLSYRSEVNANRISKNAEKIISTQELSCQGSNEILTKFNEQQDALIAIVKNDSSLSTETRDALIEAYTDGRIDPLPICERN